MKANIHVMASTTDKQRNERVTILSVVDIKVSVIGKQLKCPGKIPEVKIQVVESVRHRWVSVITQIFLVSGLRDSRPDVVSARSTALVAVGALWKRSGTANL